MFNIYFTWMYDKSHFETLLQIVHKMSSDIGMTFELSKYQTEIIKCRTIVQGADIKLDALTTISAMENCPCRYLDVLMTNKVEQNKIKEILMKSFKERLRYILKTTLMS